MNITRRDALLGATAAAVVTGAAVVPLAIKAAGVKVALAGDPAAVQGEDAELIALGRQWIDAYGKWIGTEDDDSTLLKRCHSIENRIADIPARSHHGALVKLRVVAEFYRLMGDIDDSSETRLIYQAWEALETERFNFECLRLAGEART